LTYAELAAAMPEAGGSSSFARHAFNDMISFVAGWALLMDYIVTIAISAYTIGPYLGTFFPVLKTAAGNIPFALAIIGVLLLLNLVGIKESTRISLLLCIFDIVTQLAIITLGAALLLNLPHLVEQMRIGVPNVDWSPTWPQFWKGVGMAMVAYIGIESMSQLAGETRHPGKVVPRAMLLAMMTLFLTYFGISTVALSVLSPHELATTYLEDPLAGIAQAMPYYGHFLGKWVGVLGGTILFIAANAGLIGASRLTFSMGEYFQLPRIFYRIHPRFKTPYVSLIFFAGLAAAVILVARKLTFLADLYNFGAMLAFALAHLSLLGLRWRRPELPRPFKVRGNLRLGKIELPVTAILGLLGTVAVWIDVILTKPAGRNLGFLWLGVGLTLYLTYRRQQRLPAAGHVEIERLQVPEFAKIPIRKILVPTRGGPQTEAVQFAAQIAKLHNAALTTLYVIEIPATLPLDTFFPEKLAEADSVLARAQAVGREYEIPIETKVLQSRFAGETILDVARQEGADLIILGSTARSSGPTAQARPLLGGTIEHVIKNSPCRVWVCQTPSSAEP
ncbi:MAG: amino acid permease, partial [Candidatus Omnitrophica bacterium]|nr:amino acid permease [Candidatus Omnitrophota bacterium]